MLVQMFTLPFSMPTYGREESVFFLFQNQKDFQTTVMNIKSKTSKHFYKTDFFFSKTNEKGEDLFS